MGKWGTEMLADSPKFAELQADSRTIQTPDTTLDFSFSPLYICSVTNSWTLHLLNILSHCLSSYPYNYCSVSNHLFSCLDHLFPTFYYRDFKQHKKVERIEQWICLLPALYVCVCARARARVFSCVWLFGTPWTVVQQAPLRMEFSRQEYWSGFPFLPPESSWLTQRSNPHLLHLLYWQVDSLPLSCQGSPDTTNINSWPFTSSMPSTPCCLPAALFWSESQAVCQYILDTSVCISER